MERGAYGLRQAAIGPVTSIQPTALMFSLLLLLIFLPLVLLGLGFLIFAGLTVLMIRVLWAIFVLAMRMLAAIAGA
jgi:hypothetical protein